MHVSYGSDRGGNSVHVEWFGSKSNLHQVWDEKIIQKWNSDLDDAVNELSQIIADNPSLVQQYTASLDPSDWANESFAYVRSNCYDFNSMKRKSKATPQLGQAYYAKNLPVVQQRLIAGGIRLAQVLNTVLSNNNTLSDFQHAIRLN